MPVGRLREPASAKKRADVIIITKVPQNISAIEKRLFLLDIDAQSHQQVYFTAIKYGEPQPVFENSRQTGDIDFMQNDLSVFLVTGIANPSVLITELSKGYKQVIPVRYPDHYTFTQNDIDAILEKYRAIPETNKVILTTEKDAMRLKTFDKVGNVPEAWYYIPIEIEFLSNEAEQFNRYILHYVKNNHRNSILYKK
jgi:tetraacyldisaccharide 4'-kinase